MDKKKLAIAIPASVISDTPHLREKTSKIGLIGRATAIFRVDEIIVYPDNPKANQVGDLDFISLLLSYLETPQYLRKRLFKLEPSLQFAGILPPLRTPHHPVSGKTWDLKAGEYREGMVLSKTKEGLLVDIGVEQPAVLRETQYAVGDRLTLQIVNVGGRIEVQTANRDDVPSYWGYRVRVEKRPFGQVVTDEEFDLTIATARIGDKFMDVADQIGKKWSVAQHILVAFGAPSRGLHKIAKEEGAKLEAIVDFIVNTVPGQGTATVRTEEALLASLAILNVQFHN
ncbi:MAG: RNA methyltransferase [Candidatus Bathyarchaeia archaeon]|jgi:predicted SPOUT superfamily RNA methylase MTH1